MSNDQKTKTSYDAWRIFRIVSEFVEGFETMTSLGASVAIFGSSLTTPDNPYYEQASRLASQLAQKGLAIITGGGPGIMSAANEGAQLANGKSCGICINLPQEKPNPFIDEHYLLHFRYFFVRKVMFIRYARSFVVFPGGFGTMDELFEATTLVKTEKISKIPIILIGKSYWSGLLEWLRATPIAHGNIAAEDLKLLTLTDDLDEAVALIESHCQKVGCLENF